jgi:hypothetical protein
MMTSLSAALSYRIVRVLASSDMLKSEHDAHRDEGMAPIRKYGGGAALSRP